MREASGISRRSFLLAGAAGSTGLALGLGHLQLKAAPPLRVGDVPLAAPAPQVYVDWRDVYRERFRWDRVVRTTHFVNCWYQGSCCWNVFLRDGIVWREEQVGEYPQTKPGIPDANPRGCQKGACFSERMYDPSRVRYPLKRVGPRGSGQWKRIPLDEALGEIADSMLDVLAQGGSERIMFEEGTLFTGGTMSMAHQRFAALLDCTTLDQNSEIGDEHRGAAETFGKIVFERSLGDYFYSDLILIWGGNPAFTQIPNFHYLAEARYNGAQIACIAPDYSASARHADLWVPLDPGSDAALGLGIAHVLVEEDLVDRDFVVEQTDLAMLVREDTQQYLRGSDLGRGGSDDQLYLHDRRRGVVPAPTRSLALESLEPSLEGRFEVTLGDGSTVAVRTAFSVLRERLADYSPEKAARMCGTPASVIRDLALRIGRAKAVSMVTTANFGKYYHGNLIERTQALVFALTGNYGKKGTGFVGFPAMAQNGGAKLLRDMFSIRDMMSPGALRAMGRTLIDTTRMKLAGYTDEMIGLERSAAMLASGRITSAALFYYIHGGVLEASEKVHEWDPHLKRPVREVLEEALDKGWQTVCPPRGDDPEIMFFLATNPLRRVRSYPRLLETLWPKLRTIVTLEIRMSSTALQSDYVLPAAAWYERSEHKWATPLLPFIHGGAKATSYYEAKSDWETISRLVMALEKRARERGMTSYVDRDGNRRPLHDVYEKFSQGGQYGPTDDEKILEALLDRATNVGGVTWDELKEKGFAPFTEAGDSMATEIEPGETITPFTRHVFEKVPYPTLSRRMQFYLDQELYLEMGEQLPVHKDPPTSGGAYPLMLGGGHTRWSIHGSWRDDALMLQQQRGEPLMLMAPADAAERGIADGARVRVFNDLDEFEILAKTSPALRAGQVIIYHAWENFQFKGGKGFQNLIPAPLNAVELAGGQFHIRPRGMMMQPGHTDRDTRVEVALA